MILQTLTAGIAMKPAPINAKIQSTNFVNPVAGATSPYPMVVMETLEKGNLFQQFAIPVNL